MMKPILWLGALEDFDVDYDPLLGRSAKEVELRFDVVPARLYLDPDRSVFDDPTDLSLEFRQALPDWSAEDAGRANWSLEAVQRFLKPANEAAKAVVAGIGAQLRFDGIQKRSRQSDDLDSTAIAAQRPDIIEPIDHVRLAFRSETPQDKPEEPVSPEWPVSTSAVSDTQTGSISPPPNSVELIGNEDRPRQEAIYLQLEEPRLQDTVEPSAVLATISQAESKALDPVTRVEERQAPAIEPEIAAPLQPDSSPVSWRRQAHIQRRRRVKANYVATFLGIVIFGIALLMTLASSLAAFGYPFDSMSSYRWYWIILSVLAASMWVGQRNWIMTVACVLVLSANLFVTLPAAGKSASGGNDVTAVVGWANVDGSDQALAQIFKDADKRKATLLMLAEAPGSVVLPPSGWTLIAAPVADNPTSIAVLSKSNWRASAMLGEPTMARSLNGDLTIIGLHPEIAQKGLRRTPMRDALINRAGTRAGVQEGPTIVLGDFNAAPWDRTIKQFKDYGNVTRVRCGGWAGATLTKAFGLIGVATDHAFVRDVKVARCRLGATLPGGHHKPIWLSVAPLPRSTTEAVVP